MARSILIICVPEVYSWSAQTDNEVGSEYIIMAEAVDSQIAESWESMAREDKVFIMKDLVAIEKKMLSTSFNWQSVYIRPLILQARHPDLFDYDSEVILEASQELPRTTRQ